MWYPEEAFDRSASLTVFLENPLLRVEPYAYAASLAYASTTDGLIDTTSAQAIADPIFRFDQAAFDLMALELGQPTFDLASAFAFEFSPGVANGVIPEPATGAALCGGLALLGVFVHRRSRGRRTLRRR